MLQRIKQFFLNIRQRLARSIYDIAPELKDRIPIIRTALGNWGKADERYDYQENVWVYKAIKIWTDSLRYIRFRITTKEGKEIKNHPVLDILEHNTVQPFVEFQTQLFAGLGITGDVAIQMLPNRQLKVWPGSRIQVITDQTNTAITNYLFTEGTITWKVHPDDVLFFGFYNPLDEWRGQSPLSVLRLPVDNDNYVNVWYNKYFANGAHPGLAIFSQAGITSTRKREIEDEFSSTHGQSINAFGYHRPIVLTGRVDQVQTISHPPSEIEWNKLTEKTRLEIGAAYGIPPELMGFGKATYENYRVAHQILWTDTLLPLTKFRDFWFTYWFRKLGRLSPELRIESDLSKVWQLKAAHQPLFEIAQLCWEMGVPFNQLDRTLGLGIGEIPDGNKPFGGFSPRRTIANGD